MVSGASVAMSAKGRLDSVYKPVAPGLLYLDDAAWEAATTPHRLIQFSPNPQSPGPGVLDQSYVPPPVRKA